MRMGPVIATMLLACSAVLWLAAARAPVAEPGQRLTGVEPQRVVKEIVA